MHTTQVEGNLEKIAKQIVQCSTKYEAVSAYVPHQPLHCKPTMWSAEHAKDRTHFEHVLLWPCLPKAISVALFEPSSLGPRILSLSTGHACTVEGIQRAVRTAGYLPAGNQGDLLACLLPHDVHTPRIYILQDPRSLLFAALHWPPLCTCSIWQALKVIPSTL